MFIRFGLENLLLNRFNPSLKLSLNVLLNSRHLSVNKRFHCISNFRMNLKEFLHIFRKFIWIFLSLCRRILCLFEFLILMRQVCESASPQSILCFSVTLCLFIKLFIIQRKLSGLLFILNRSFLFLLQFFCRLNFVVIILAHDVFFFGRIFRLTQEIIKRRLCLRGIFVRLRKFVEGFIEIFVVLIVHIFITKLGRVNTLSPNWLGS